MGINGDLLMDVKLIPIKDLTPISKSPIDPHYPLITISCLMKEKTEEEKKKDNQYKLNDY